MCGRGGGKGKRESGGGREGMCRLNCTWIECNMYQHMISLHTTVCPTHIGVGIGGVRGAMAPPKILVKSV